MEEMFTIESPPVSFIRRRGLQAEERPLKVDTFVHFLLIASAR
jgi:hypothetical protein